STKHRYRHFSKSWLNFCAHTIHVLYRTYSPNRGRIGKHYALCTDRDRDVEYSASGHSLVGRSEGANISRGQLSQASESAIETIPITSDSALACGLRASLNLASGVWLLQCSQRHLTSTVGNNSIDAIAGIIANL